MFPKILQYEDPLFENTQEPRVRLLEAHRNKAGFYKHACAEVNDYLATIQPQPGKRYVLVLAMSATEYYGPNRNGDGFAERPVKVKGEWAVAPGETLLDHYKSFETHANVFAHHINKDPNKGYGKVAKAFYNHTMHRVELLLEIDEHKAAGQHFLSQINQGEFPGVSMGCRIRYDVCSICANKAPTRDDYCEHVNGFNPSYGMNALLENGERCFVWNPSPLLFDISFVFKPADKVGYMMRKVAYSAPYELKLSADVGRDVEELSHKRAALQKLSDIDKVLHGEVVNPNSPGLQGSELHATKSLAKSIVPAVVPSMTDLPADILQDLSKLSVPSMLSSMSASGMCPTGSEIHVIIASKLGTTADPVISKKVAAIQGLLAAALVDTPTALDALESQGLLKMSEDLVDVYAVNRLKPYQEKRALWEDYVARKYIPDSWGTPVGTITGAFSPDNAYYEPAMQNLHYRDDETGRIYQTTRHTAERADVDNHKKLAIEGAGLAALLGLSVKSLTARNKWRWLAPPALMGAGALGYNIIDNQKVPTIETLEGVKVPANTEFVEKRSSFGREILVPLTGGALATFLLAQDHIKSNGQHGGGVAGSLGQTAHEHPYLTTMVGAGTISGGLAGLDKLRHLIKRAAVDPEKVAHDDPCATPSISFPDLVYAVGTYIVDGV